MFDVDVFFVVCAAPRMASLRQVAKPVAAFAHSARGQLFLHARSHAQILFIVAPSAVLLTDCGPCCALCDAPQSCSSAQQVIHVRWSTKLELRHLGQQGSPPNAGAGFCAGAYSMAGHIHPTQWPDCGHRCNHSTSMIPFRPELVS